MKPFLALSFACMFPLISGAQESQALKVDVELVQVYAAVTDPKGRFVTDLKAEDFKVSENGTEQKIEGFSSDDAPISVGIVMGAGGTIGNNLPLAKLAALSFLKASHLRNEYFLIEFNDKAEVTEDYTNELSKLDGHSQFLKSKRNSADYDAIYLALDKLRDAANPKKVLLVFTSGGDIRGAHKPAQVRDLARQLDVQIFGVTATDVDQHGDITRETDGFEVINAVGGQVLVPDTAADYLTTCKRIAVAVRNQYIFTYRSTDPTHDGKYRHLQVKLSVPGELGLSVHTRDGYYAKSPDTPGANRR